MNKIRLINKGEIINLLKNFNKDTQGRYASFDFCFNYFQGFRERGKIDEIDSEKNREQSCLQLGFYLASWGMYRGSTSLLQKSVKVFEPLIEYIASEDCDVWSIDVDKYTPENIAKLINCRKRIEKELNMEQKSMDILVTKIMLGVFGNVPAFDGYFKNGSNLGTFNTDALRQVYSFYGEDENKDIISKKADEIKTFEYKDSKEGKRPYTKAKVIDMIFFEKGLELEEAKKKNNKKK